jgi:hypothetical protein
MRDEDRGAVAVIVAMSMVVLLIAAAFSVDIGAMYSERSQLQNAADASAIGVAQACASAACTTQSATTEAQSLANANSNDGASKAAVTFAPAGGSVSVTTSTVDGRTGDGFMKLSFAPIAGITTKTLAATATAAWGSPSGGPAVIALAFAPCQFNTSGATQVIYEQSNSGTCQDGQGQTISGGFGWLTTSSNSCSTIVAAGVSGTIFSSSPGASVPAACAAALNAYLNQTILLPVFSNASGTGSGGTYTVQGFVAFQLLGWGLPGTSYPANAGNYKGITGKFVKFVSTAEGFTLGGTNFGATVAQLTQ